MKLAALVAACTLALAACSSAAPPTGAATGAPVVEAPAGALRGAHANGINVFKGIPFAAPPIDAARWKPPVPAAGWQGVREATTFGPACMQPTSVGAGIYAQNLNPMSEDCLTLNIWAPADARNAPVFFWIHGGALNTGSSKEPMYNGEELAKRGIVVVSVNYRLGLFGYLAHPELSAESPDGVSGNYGTLDQIAALKWVQANISAFGGNASDVTIAGESAGGLSVMYLMASPKARGLFSKAIAQSAYMVSTPDLKQAAYGAPSAEQAGVAIAARLGASNLAALRAKNAGDLVNGAALGGFAPFGAIDGRVLTRQLVDTFARGEQAPVPLMAGFNSGEIRSLTVLAPPRVGSAAEYERVIGERYGDLASEFLRLYPAADMQESIYANSRDALYGWTAERLVRNQAATGAPGFLYFFDHGYPAAGEAKLHGFHAAELPYVFGTLKDTPRNWPRIPSTPREQQFSEAMISYWTSFVKTGQPTAPGLPAWTPYGATKSFMHFGDTPVMSARLHPGMFELHEEAVCRRKANGNQPWNWNTGLASPPLGAPCPR